MRRPARAATSAESKSCYSRPFDILFSFAQRAYDITILAGVLPASTLASESEMEPLCPIRECQQAGELPPEAQINVWAEPSPVPDLQRFTRIDSLFTPFCPEPCFYSV